VSVGTDGVSVGGDQGVEAGTDGVSVAGQDVGGAGLPSGDGDTPSLPGGSALPGAGVGEVPTGPVPVDIDYSMGDGGKGLIQAETDEGPRGAQAGFTLGTFGTIEGDRRFISELELSDTDRKYIDLEGVGTAGEDGVENVDGAVYTVNESGGTYVLALSRDAIGARGVGVAQGENVGFVNAQNAPGTQQGSLGGGLFAQSIAGLGPELPVGPTPPRVVGGGVECTGQECTSGTFGINQSDGGDPVVPDNQVTKPVKGNYPLPRTSDASGVVLPCSKPVTSDDLPTEQLPGVSDLPKGTLPGVPTSLLTNDAVFGLAFGVTPAPCDVSEPLASPVANPATSPGEYEGSPTTNFDKGMIRTNDGVSIIRGAEFGPGNGAGTADGSIGFIQRDGTGYSFNRLDVSDSEYEYFVISQSGVASRENVVSEFDTSLRDGYAGVGGDLQNEPGTSNGEAGLRISAIGRKAGFSLTCTPSGCQPDYDGLPKLGSLPTFPNPLAGDTGLPA
jgi:hypothetical protein